MIEVDAGARIIALSQALSDLTAALNRWMECMDGPTEYDADVAWLKLGEAQLKAMNALKPSSANREGE
jgi:hypothetical protein